MKYLLIAFCFLNFSVSAQEVKLKQTDSLSYTTTAEVWKFIIESIQYNTKFNSAESAAVIEDIQKHLLLLRKPEPAKKP